MLVFDGYAVTYSVSQEWTLIYLCSIVSLDTTHKLISKPADSFHGLNNLSVRVNSQELAHELFSSNDYIIMDFRMENAIFGSFVEKAEAKLLTFMN